jgi:hypothetical protein
MIVTGLNLFGLFHYYSSKSSCVVDGVGFLDASGRTIDVFA